MTMENDREIVDKILAGESRVVRVFYERISKRLEKYFAHHVQQTTDIDELIQDTFLHVLDALPLFQYQSSLQTFVLGIAKHELMDYWRKKYAKRVVKTVPLLKSLPSHTQSSVDTSRQIHEAMQQAYAHLKPLQVQLLRLKYEEEKSVKEIAFLLGMTTKAVETQLYRARKAFQAVFDGKGIELAWLYNETN